MTDRPTPRDGLGRLVVPALCLMLAVGLWLRVRNLGALGLVVDEGNQALAIRGMLRHGIPLVDSGLVYARNILYMIAQALSAAALGLGELSLRLPSAVFGVAAIAAAYLLAARLFGRGVALMAALLMTFSAWQLELSRYARFYTAFQALFLLSLTCFYQGYILDRRAWRPWFLLSALLTIMTHELGGLLGVCFLIPVLSERFGARRKLWNLCGAAGLIVFWMVYRRLFDVVRVSLQSPELSVVNRPVDPVERARLYVGLPGVRLPRIDWVLEAFREQPLIFGSLATLTAVVALWIAVRAARSGALPRLPLWLLALVAAFFQQFALVALVLALDAIVFARSRRKLLEPAALAVYLTTPALLLIWAAALLVGTDVAPGSIPGMLFRYPDCREYFFHWLWQGWPWMTAGFALGSLMLLRRAVRHRDDLAPVYLLGMLFGPMVLTSVFRSFHEARYIAHLFPLALIVFSVAAAAAGRHLLDLLPASSRSRLPAAALLVAAMLLADRDTRPWEARAVTERTYADATDPVRNVINWRYYADFHQDHETTGVYVRERRRPGDRVLAFGPPHMIGNYHYYTGGVTHLAGRPGDLGYYRQSADGRIVGWVTGSEVVMGVAEIEALLELAEGRRAWLLADSRLLAEGNVYYDESVKGWLRDRGDDPAYLGRDGRTFVLRFDGR